MGFCEHDVRPVALQFSFEYKAEDEKNSLRLLFKRRTDAMPPAPRVSNLDFLHPRGLSIVSSVIPLT